MRKTLKNLAVSSMVLFSCSVAAKDPQWVRIDYMDTGQVQIHRYLDVANISNNDGYKFVWARWEDNRFSRNGDGTRNPHIMFSHIKIDCKKMIWTSVYNEIYESGKLTESGKRDIPWNLYDNKSESNVKMFKLVC
jgi:hypothetical protein